MKISGFSVCLVIALTILLSACASSAATADQPAARQQQIAAGETVYSGICSKCHGANMQGDIGPELTMRSLGTFKNAKEMYDLISRKMPVNDPGSLSSKQYLDVEAYLLDKIGALPAGKTLTQNNLSQIQISQQ